MDLPPDPVYSPRFSFKGWSWKALLVKNKESLKWGITLLFAYFGILVTSVLQPELKAFLVWLVGFVVKMVLNVIDYWLTENPG